MTKLPRPRIDLALAATRMALPSFAATALVLSIGFAIAGYAAWALSSVIIAAAWLAAGCYGRWEGWIDLGLGAAVVLTIVGVRYGIGGIWGLASVIIGLTGWDLLHFARRLSLQSQPIEARALQRSHLRRLLLSNLIGATLGILAISVKLSIGLIPVLALTLLAVFLLGRLARWSQGQGRDLS